MIKIVFVSLWAHKLFNPDESQPFGGAELQLKLITSALAQNPDLEVHFVTRGQGNAECFDFEGITVHKLPYYKTAIQRKLLGTLDLYKKLKEVMADVYIQRGSGIETAVTALAARQLDRRFLFMTASLWDVNGSHAAYIGRVAGAAYRWGFKRAHCVVTQSKEQQDCLHRLYGKESTVLRSAHPIPAEIPSQRDGILWISRCEPCKRPALYLELAQAFPGKHFTMICPIANEPELFETIQARAESIPNLTFSDGVSFEETERLFASHQIFVNTSDMEGFPNTFVQAVKWGMPILSLEVNPDHMLIKEKIGYCAEGNFSRLEDQLQNFLVDKAVWQICSQNGRRYAQENHDIQRIAGRLADLIKDLVEKK